MWIAAAWGVIVLLDDLEFGQRVKVYGDVWRLCGPKWNYQWPRAEKGRYIQPWKAHNLDYLPGDPVPELSGRSGKYEEEPGSERVSIRFRRIKSVPYEALVSSVCIKHEGHILHETGVDYSENYFCQEGRLQLVELLLTNQPLTVRPNFVLALPEDLEPA